MRLKHISLDQHDDRIKAFVRSLSVDPDGSILELGGHPILRILPPSEPPYDSELLKEAILRRRDESHAELAEWADAEREIWDRME